MPDRDWFPDHYPSSFFSVLIIYISRTEDIVRNSDDYKTPQPQQDTARRSNRTATAGAASITAAKHRHKLSEQGWYPTEMERNNNTNIGKQQASTIDDDAGKLLFGIN